MQAVQWCLRVASSFPPWFWPQHADVLIPHTHSQVIQFLNIIITDINTMLIKTCIRSLWYVGINWSIVQLCNNSLEDGNHCTLLNISCLLLYLRMKEELILLFVPRFFNKIIEKNKNRLQPKYICSLSIAQEPTEETLVLNEICT